jgi:hypothetical protein
MSERELADVGYLRALAEQGRNTPLVGGPFLVLLGTALAVAFLLHWVLLTEVLGSRHGLWYAATWLGFLLVATVGWLVLHGRSRAKHGSSSVVNQVDGAVWSGVLLALVAVVAGSVGRGMTTGDPQVLNAIMAAAFGLYGVALGAAGVLSGHTWLRYYSFPAFGASSLLWMFGDQEWAYPFAAASTLVVLVVPGLVMIRRRTAATA